MDEGAQDVIINALKPLGFDIYDVTRGPEHQKIRNTFLRHGTGGPHLCFCGHTDVVPAGDTAGWTHPPFDAVIDDGKLYGRGTSDMKGNIACFMAALSQFLGSYDGAGSISLLITGDEEGPAINGTVKVLGWMKENNHIPDVALVGEPTNPDALGQEIKIGRRGSLTGILKVTGTQGHVAYPHLADNPLPRLTAMLDKIAKHEFDTGNEFFPPTNLELTTIDTGNPADNIIPAAAEAHFNVRFNDQWNARTLEEKIRSLLDLVSPDYELTCVSNAASFITRPNEWTDIVAKAVTTITGQTPELSTKGGTSDARFVSTYCPVVEFGLTNKTIHQIDEHVEIADMHQLTAVYKKILENYFAV